jgi:hypothetical protein
MPEERPVRPEPDKQPVADVNEPPHEPIAIHPKLPSITLPVGGLITSGQPDLPGKLDKPVGETNVRKPELPQMAGTPAPGIYVPGLPYTPVKIEKPDVPATLIPVRRIGVDFYGTELNVATTVAENVNLAGTRESDVADAWAKLCKADSEQLVADCMTLRDEHKMNDWGFLVFTEKIGEQIYGEEATDKIAFLQMFILSKSGYKVKLSKINDKLKLMVSPAGSLYGMPYIVLDGTKYYVYRADKTSGSMSVYTYKHDFANAKNFVSMDVVYTPEFDMSEYTENVTPPSGKSKASTVVNSNLIAFYKDYPQCDVAVYYHTPMSRELKASLYPSLKSSIEGKSQKDAANILLDFVQSGFKYQTDGEQFGYEKPFFIDENFFYPACDCEDRSILYATLVKDLIGLDAVLLDYPNHIATAVCFTDDVQGDYVALEGERKYLICDPTYIGATIGMCMPQFRSVTPEIIR